MDLQQRIHEEVDDGASTDASEAMLSAPEQRHKGSIDKPAY